MFAARERALAAGCRGRLGTRLRALFFCFVVWTTADAGGSAETTLVVVNAASPLSQFVANEYLRLRGIPGTHLLRLDDVPSIGTLPINEFRHNVWQPIHNYLREHRLEGEIDLIVYSADFPYGVDFNSDVKSHKLPRHRYRGHVASLTGLTYFAHRVAAGDVGYLGTNYAFREFAGPIRRAPRSSAAAVRLGEKELKRLRKQAAAALREKDYTLALEGYRRLIDIQPEVAEHWYNLARVEAAAGQAEQALATLTEAVERGWVNSLLTKRDRKLAGLRELPGFHALLQRMETAYGPFEITHGFRHRYVWSNSDLAFWEPDDALNQYYLSMLLAYTGVRGNSIPEIGEYLSRAVASDGTAPEGTVYLLENSNVRSVTRQPLFPTTVAELARRDRKAAILGRGDKGQNGIIPMSRDDVIGAVVGTQRFDWKKSHSQMLPGAIAESLTSYGGHFDKASQTKLTAFLRHGAAGSSGAVAEPFSFQEKFPVPLLHVYYADGCSLAEAYYQSVQAPYQLIIVGDPLARPFARFAQVGLQAPDPAMAWSGVVTIDPKLQPAEGTALETVELWIDGQHLASAPAGKPLVWDTRTVEDGGHELRIVAVEDSPIETRSAYRTAISVFNRDRRITVEQSPAEVRYEQAVEITGHAPGAKVVELRRGHQLLAAADLQDGRWQLSVPASVLGMGEVMLQVRAVFLDGQGVRSAPLAIRVSEPTRLPAAAIRQPDSPGLLALVQDAQGGVRELQIDKLGGRLKALEHGGPPPARIRMRGYLKVEQSGTYQLALRSKGRLQLRLHHQLLLDEQISPGDAEAFVALGLEAGWHPLEIELEPDGRKPSLRVVLAGQTAPALLAASNLGHHAAAVAD
jgi:tetratricopeptide (TPR) repeat protein